MLANAVCLLLHVALLAEMQTANTECFMLLTFGLNACLPTKVSDMPDV